MICYSQVDKVLENLSHRIATPKNLNDKIGTFHLTQIKQKPVKQTNKQTWLNYIYSYPRDLKPIHFLPQFLLGVA